MEKIGNYILEEQIAEGGTSFVYLGRDINTTSAEKAQKVIKILKKDLISKRTEDAIRFTKESSIISQLSHPNIIRVFDFGEHDAVPYIVMEYLKGKTLENILRVTDFTLDQAIEIMAQICNGIKFIHDKGIIHGDLKASNILMGNNFSSGRFEIKIIDFGFSQVKELYFEKEMPDLFGTLNYISPEQTGITRRKVDERSDLYSLGVVFFKLLTRSLPFYANCSHTLIHKHIAEPPPRPSVLKEGIPFVVDEIILKLLEKDPEKRYQSAAGLMNDLAKIKKGNFNFTLGEDDYAIKLNFKTALIGREKELQLLKNSVASAENNQAVICIIKGEAGIGKTKLVREFQSLLEKSSIAFLEGEAFQDDGNNPYGPFQSVLNKYVYIFKKYSQEKQKRIRQSIKKHIDGKEEILLNFSPALAEIIVDCAPLMKLDPENENRRFLSTVSQLFYCIAEIETPLVLFLSDLHWADGGSFELLAEIERNIAAYPLMLVVTSREDKKIYHNIHTIINKIPRVKFYNISLGPFEKVQMNDFIVKILNYTSNDMQGLVDFIFNKSKGNPFFAIEIIQKLIKDEALISKKGTWQSDSLSLQTIEIPSAIIDIILNKISSFKEKEIHVLATAALIGSAFNIEFLFQINTIKHDAYYATIDNADIVDIIDQALELHILEADSIEKGKFMFIHDKVQEAFYSFLDVKIKKDLHLQLAQAIEKNQPRPGDTVLYSLAHHYCESGDVSNSLKYSIPAAKAFKSAYVYEKAIKYYNKSIELLESINQKESEAWINCHVELGKIYIVIGETQEGIRLFNKVLPLIDEKMLLADIYKNISEGYLKIGDWKNCENYGEKGLLLLGIKLPKTDMGIMLGIFKGYCAHVMHWMRSFLLKKKSFPEAEKYKLAVQFFYALDWAYTFSNIKKFVYSVITMLAISERKIGISNELAMSMGAYAGIWAVSGYLTKAIKLQEKTIELKRQLKDEWGSAQSLQFLGYFTEWSGDNKTSTLYFQKSLEIFQKIGDQRETGMVLNGLAQNFWLQSFYEQFKSMNERHARIVNEAQDNYGIVSNCFYQMHYYLETGDFATALQYGQRGSELSLRHEIWFVYCYINIGLGVLYSEKGNFDQAISHATIAQRVYEEHNLLKMYTAYCFAILAEAIIGKIKIFGEPKNAQNAVLKRVKKLCSKAIKETRPWGKIYPFALRALAKCHALSGNYHQAEKYFLKCIELFNAVSRRYETAKAHFEYGMFLDEEKHAEEAASHYQQSYMIFKEIGAQHYVKKLAGMIGFIEVDNELSSFKRNIHEFINKQKYDTIIKITKDLTTFLNEDDILDYIVLMLLRVIHAQRGFIFLVKNEDRDIELRAFKSIVEHPGKEEYSRSIVQKVFENGEVHIAVNASEDEEYNANLSIAGNTFKSIMCLPIKHRAVVIGAAYFDNSLSSGVFTENDVDILETCLSQAIIYMQNISLQSEILAIKNKNEMSVLEIPEKFIKKFNISKREKEIIELKLQRFSNEIISQKLAISLQTTKNHLHNIYKRTHVENREQLEELIISSSRVVDV